MATRLVATHAVRWTFRVRHTSPVSQHTTRNLIPFYFSNHDHWSGCTKRAFANPAAKAKKNRAAKQQAAKAEKAGQTKSEDDPQLTKEQYELLLDIADPQNAEPCDEFDEATEARHAVVIETYKVNKTRRENLWRARLQRIIKLRTKAIAELPPMLKEKALEIDLTPIPAMPWPNEFGEIEGASDEEEGEDNDDAARVQDKEKPAWM